MKFQLKLLALATLGLIATAPAHATIAHPTTGNGEAFFSIWDNMGTADTADDRSYTRDLGSFQNTWSNTGTNPASLLPTKTTAGYIESYAHDALLTTWLGGVSNVANVQWNVGAADGLGTKRLMSTVSNLGTISQNTYQALRNANQTAGIYIDAVNTFMPAGDSANGSISVVGNLVADASIPTAWNNNFGGRFSAGFNNAGRIGDSLDFYQFSETTASGSTTQAVKVNQFTSAYDNGPMLANGAAAKWTLTAAGDLTYAVPSAVPVPAAVWLLGSGLIGLVGVSRRRKAA